MGEGVNPPKLPCGCKPKRREGEKCKMTQKEKLEEELSRHINGAPTYRRKKVLESIEYQLAMKSGDVSAALDIAWGIIHGSGKTKAERNRAAKKIKKEDIQDLFA
jgi:hypothetical protein